MIKVHVLKDKIVISGHALYDDYGKDIVCASVSSIVTTTVNALVRYDESSINYISNEELTIDILKHDSIIDLLIDNMLELFNQLEKQYPKNIRRC